MENPAIGGSAFVHKSNETKKQPVSSMLATIAMCLMFFVFFIYFFYAVSLKYNVPLLIDLNSAKDSIYGGFLSESDSRKNARWWSLMPAFVMMLCVVLNALVPMGNRLKNRIIGSIGLLLVSIFLALVNPFSPMVAGQETLPQWAENYYGVKVDAEQKAEFKTSDGKQYYKMYRDENREIVFAIHDPKRNNEIFLYKIDATTELAKKDEKHG